MDGVDASIIQSDGETKYKVIIDKYFRYPQGIYKNLIKLRDKIKSSKDLKKFSTEVKNVEKEITLFHAKAVSQILKKTKVNVDFIGFHGQTIFHNAEEKISRQLGDGKLLSKLTNKTVIYDFRQNDLRNFGEGAPLTPIFHKLLVKQNKINLPATIINIGGIINMTTIQEDGRFDAKDAGPGMCLIDKWIRSNSIKKYDNKGNIAKAGKINEKILSNGFNSYFSSIDNNLKILQKSFDVKFFEYFFGGASTPLLKSLSLEDGVATLTEFTAKILSFHLVDQDKGAPHIRSSLGSRFIFCGGGRKNNFLLEKIKKEINGKVKVELIDKLGIDGDFVESQAFAYLAIRSYLKLPISFPETTGVRKPCTGGIICKN